MDLDDRIQVGELVTVRIDTFGLNARLFEDKSNLNKTIYPWDNVSIKKGTIGLVLDFVNKDTLFLKVLWTIERESVVLYVRLNDLKLLDYNM
jgi:hypothetical protein